MDSISFLHAIEETHPKIIDRVVALIWFHGNGDDESAVNLRTLCEEIETAGFAKQNQTRLRAALKKDRRVLSKKDDCFALNAKHKSKVEEQYGEHARIRKLRKSDAVLPTDLFSQAKGYIQKVVLQLNASYDHNLFDCTAVMCRRLLETLIIEAYEHTGKADSIKGVDGHYLMFSGLMSQINKSCPFQLGRNSMKGLTDFKSLGDLSAHNRRFNARKSDLDKVQDGLRVACEELLHIAGQGPDE
jgi:hypothetical protein